MPPQAQVGVGAAQRSSSNFIIYSAEKMNTRVARIALPENEAAWLENLQPIAPNNLTAVPAALAALAMLTGESVQSMFGANIGAVDYTIAFTAAGAGIAINILTGAKTTFAADGTFSNPDMTVYASQRILIQDPVAGYSTWDGTVFVTGGGVSPNINVTAGGSGYTSAPNISITGGSGTGSTAHSVVGGGALLSIVLDTAGTGYKAGDTLTVTIGGPGVGATATARIWPIQLGTTIAVFGGRVWWASGRVLNWTGTATGTIDDTNTANAAGSTTISDSDLSHSITGLRNLNNYLFIFGDTSVRQIGSISVSGSVTLFTPLILSSDIGTPFPRTIASYNRLVVFANKVGVYAIFGASVEKISDDLDGIFKLVDFTLAPSAALNDLRNIHCYLLLLRYLDPVAGPRSIIATLQSKTWFVISQGDGLTAIASAPLKSTSQVETFGSSGTDLTQLVADPTTAVPVTLRTALSPHQNPIQAKKTIRAGVNAQVAGSATISLQMDSEASSRSNILTASAPITWLNNSGQVINFINNLGLVITFCGTGFSFPYTDVEGFGKFLGLTITTTAANFSLNLAAVEYQDAALWASGTAGGGTVTNPVPVLKSIGTFTLTPSATTTTVSVSVCTPQSIVLYDPVTADAGNDMATTSYIAGLGQFVVTHASNSRTDRTFNYAVLG